MKRFFTLPRAEAHCDVPCGIYDPVTAQQAALSVVRFIDQIEETIKAGLDQPGNQAKFSRLVAEKERHAASVKSEIVVIWGDYFKPAHVDQHPGIHAITHQILRTASACKQELSRQNALDLVEQVNAFAAIFWETKGIDTQRVTVPYEPKLVITQAVLAATN